MADNSRDNIQLKSPLVELKSGIYFLKVISAQDMRPMIRYKLEDCAGFKYTALSKHRVPIGGYLRCSVWVGVFDGEVKTDVAVCQHQFDPNNPTTQHKPKPSGQAPSSQNGHSKPDNRQALENNTPKKTEVDYSPLSIRYQPKLPERKAMEIFEKMKELGFHKCGKAFTCSCCGESFDKYQGIVSDVKEIYLCNSCRAGQKKRERTTSSLRTISIPMGNKR